ncbi:hypothetical protein BBJ28_00021692 [Nothophytophthora sp. Chile5]|nr:hypothetical protein BBJ28_00021692 [Nothophytophthora sp. Chile5]
MNSTRKEEEVGVKADATAVDGHAEVETNGAVDDAKMDMDDSLASKQETGRVQTEEQEAEGVKPRASSNRMRVKKDVSVDRNGDKREKEAEDDRSHIRRKAVECDAALRDSIEWTVAEGAEVDSGQKLGTAGLLEEGTQRRLAAPCRGRLYILTEAQMQELQVAAESATATQGKEGLLTVAFVEYCIHPVRNGRTCLMCLAVVDESEEGDDMGSVNVVSHGQVIRLNMEEASTGWRADVRLCWLLAEDTHFFFIPGLAQQHVVKLRPGLAVFLTELSALYDLFIYTHGTRLYAEQIVKIIDPDESYFKNRIVARTDTPDMLHKSLKLLFPSCDDSMILVLDDRIDVWKENEGNVFLIEPYHYFKCTAEINNASGQGVTGLEDNEAESSEDTHLVQTTAVLKHVHEVFYEGHEQGMKGTTAEGQMAGRGRDQKHSILQGCRIVFSGVFPIAGARSHEAHYLWRLAVDLGATPSMVLKGFPITHLVEGAAPAVSPDEVATASSDASNAVPSGANEEAATSTPVPAALPAAVKTVPSILVKREPGDTKKSKQVTFATVIDDSGRTDEGDDAQKRKSLKGDAMKKRLRAMRQETGVGRARTFAIAPVATGVVATGGTFDFLSKIRAAKRETPASTVKAKKLAEEAKKAQARPPPPPKDVDDAFLRLIEAEERENELEQKRKESSRDIKDQLSSRRSSTKSPSRVAGMETKGKRIHEADATTSQTGEKRVRLASPAQSEKTNSADEVAGDEEEDEDGVSCWKGLRSLTGRGIRIATGVGAAESGPTGSGIPRKAPLLERPIFRNKIDTQVIATVGCNRTAQRRSSTLAQFNLRTMLAKATRDREMQVVPLTRCLFYRAPRWVKLLPSKAGERANRVYILLTTGRAPLRLQAEQSLRRGHFNVSIASKRALEFLAGAANATFQ